MEKKLKRISSILAADDTIIFVGDGVLNNMKIQNCGRVLYLEPDMTARGIDSSSRYGKIISIQEMVEIIAADTKSPVSW